MQWLRRTALRRRARQCDVRVRGLSERQVNRHDGADAFLALDLKRPGYLALISETFAFLSTLEPVMLAVD